MNKIIVNRRIVINVLIGFVFLVAVLTFYSTFSLEDNYKFESLVYDINDSYIEDVSVNTSIELFLKYFDLENCTIQVVNKNNEKMTSGFIVNGSKTILYDDNKNVIATYINVIKGDYVSDGIVDSNDFYSMGKCLVNKCSMDEYLKRSVDIDDDGEFHINDLLLLDKAITLGYQSISVDKDSVVLQTGEKGRLVSKLEPNYGINQNVKWVSLNDEVATVNDAGVVIGNKEGETKVQAITMDGKLSKEVIIKVDNTVQLSSYEGTGYIGGNNVIVKIKSVDYEGITCNVENDALASCEIKDKNLILKPTEVGSTIVTVISPKYGEVVYSLDTVSVYLNVMPKYLCATPGNVSYITVSGFHNGDLSFEFSDQNIIKDAYMQLYQTKNMLRINFGTKQGRATLKVMEGNANTSNVVTVDVSRISTTDVGKVAKIGEDVSTTIVGYMGELSCISSDTNKGTCRIEGDKLIVTPISLGSVTVDVYNKFSYNGALYDCGQAQFLVVVQE